MDTPLNESPRTNQQISAKKEDLIHENSDEKSQVSQSIKSGEPHVIETTTTTHIVAVTAHQPIETRITNIEVPVVKYVDKVVKKPSSKNKHFENPIIQPQIFKKPASTTTNYIPEIHEIIRYKDVNTVEEVIRYVPEGYEDYSLPNEKTETQNGIDSKSEPHSKGESINNNVGPRIDHLYQPVITDCVEIEKRIPVDVNVPIPYMVPKPVVIPIEVPCLKFNDHYIPCPVRRRIIPKIVWTNKVFEVECIREIPYLEVEDVIKTIPCDAEIVVQDDVVRAQPMDPAELSNADVHAMWMRVNAQLAENADWNSFNVEADPDMGYKENEETPVDNTESNPYIIPDIPHEINMTAIQNSWIQTSTLETNKMYTSDWIDTHQKAIYNLQTGQPIQASVVQKNLPEHSHGSDYD